ncbi:MAG: hypothetical protein AMXMBFR58_16320 [Phycisphaerae bacterium]
MATPAHADFEKLGSFYLGRRYDLERRQRTGDPVLYDSRDLVTHAVCVGMTGSGKTGLCVGLLEEAAIDGIPAIIIDPKGDLGNMLLTFEQLRPEDFRPWINTDDARRAGVTADEFAAAQSASWRAGLAEWGQDASRIGRLRSSAEWSIYTPGSSAGEAVSVLRSFDAPPAALLDDAELLQERVSTTVTGLLGLVGITADPVQSREHILISTILAHAWSRGESPDLSTLIRRVQQPPVPRIGVMDVDTFFPADQRFGLALQINNLIAAPGFSRWMDGTPLDPAKLLYTQDGRPRHAIFSISHLSDSERMFFVSLLLNQVLGWVRAQPGTTSLRALVYMDEIAGYFPPVAQPPSKRPLLTLMKQARAQGVGVVLATQNPVDLDYKGLSNAGTWFIGRLQTDRDKQRVLDGLEGASPAGMDRAAMDRVLSSLTSRVFLMHNVHDAEPTVFQTRWTLSYLRGPMTRDEIRAVSAAQRKAATTPDTRPDAASPTRPKKPFAEADTSPIGPRPLIAEGVPEFFVAESDGAGAVYTPVIAGFARVHYTDAKAKIDVDEAVSVAAPLSTGPIALDWTRAVACGFSMDELSKQPAADAKFHQLPAEASKARSYETWGKSLATYLQRTRPLTLMRCSALGVVSRRGESEAEFQARVRQAAREERDRRVEQIRAKFGARVRMLQERVRKAEQVVDVQKEQAATASVSGVLSIGSALLGAFLGRKPVSSSTVGRAATAARGAGRAMKEKSDVGRAMEDLATAREELNRVEEELSQQVQSIAGEVEAQMLDVDRVEIKPKRGSVAVQAVVLVWVPGPAEVSSSEGAAPSGGPG